jgi:hypothetical protein
MARMAPHTWLDLQLLEGQKPYKRDELWIGKGFDNNLRMFPNNPSKGRFIVKGANKVVDNV